MEVTESDLREELFGDPRLPAGYCKRMQRWLGVCAQISVARATSPGSMQLRELEAAEDKLRRSLGG